MKALLFPFLALAMVLSSPLRAERPVVEDDTFYTEEDDQLFNRGKFVGVESDEALRAQRRQRNKNWAIAIGSTAVGIATLFVASNHHHR